MENPTQDPGSDYGEQKRACRELLDEWATRDGGDPRIPILPGVLHGEPVWGNGTTEYALDAMLAAARGHDELATLLASYAGQWFTVAGVAVASNGLL